MEVLVELDDSDDDADADAAASARSKLLKAKEDFFSSKMLKHFWLKTM